MSFVTSEGIALHERQHKAGKNKIESGKAEKVGLKGTTRRNGRMEKEK